MNFVLFIIGCGILFALILAFEFFGWIASYIFKIVIGFPLFCLTVYWVIQIFHDANIF